MKKLFIPILALFLFCLCSGCGCEHQWIDANCTAAKTCSLCQKTEGVPLNHIWQDATCTAAKTCTVCGKSEGDLSDHIWLDATCTTAKTCQTCHLTEGDPLPHTPGNSAVTTDLVRGAEVTVQSCTVCNQTLTETLAPISLVKDDLFLLSAEDFVARMNHVYRETGKTNWSAELVTTEKEGIIYSRAILCKDSHPFAEVVFRTPEHDPETATVTQPVAESQKSEAIICQFQILINFYDLLNHLYDAEVTTRVEAEPGNPDAGTNEVVDLISMYSQHGSELYQEILIPVYLACDPKLTSEEASDAVSASWDYIMVLLDISRISYSDTCGDLFTKYTNFFMLNYLHTIGIGSTAEFA